MFVIALACSSPGTIPPDLARDLDGAWTGQLEVGGSGLRLVLHLDEQGGRLTGIMDSPDQGAVGIPLSGFDGTQENLTFQVPSVSGRWNGALRGDALEGTWQQAGAAMPLSFARGLAPPKPRPQDPIPPFPYRSTELTVPSAPGVTLSGTLTHPDGPGPYPGIVLVSGSGPQDRDEALMGHRPFLVLADALTRAGVAVLRYDDRGVGHSTGAFEGATTHDFAVDAAAALRALRDRPDIGQVGVLGHSEGGIVAALVAGAELAPPPAFVVLVAAPAVSGKALLEGQVEALARATGQDGAAARAAQSAILDVIARDGTEAELRAAMAAAGVPPEQIAAQAGAMASPWYRAFVKLDPAPHLARLTSPVLALYGDRDLQVPAAENAPALSRALSTNPRATVTVLPGLNHLLQPATTGLPTEYGAIDTTIDPSALAAIAQFVSAAGGSP